MSDAERFVNNGKQSSAFQRFGAWFAHKNQSAQLWLVGVKPESHYTPGDIYKISNLVPKLVVASAAAGGAAITGTLVETANVTLPYAAPIGVAWATALVLLDRTIIHQDAIAKADRKIEQWMAKEMGVVSSRLSRVLQRAQDMTPALLRIALVAAPISFINTQSALNVVLHNDIKDELVQEYKEDNAALFRKSDEQKAAYDGQTNAVEETLKKLRGDLEAQRGKLLKLNASTGVTTAQDRVMDQIETLRQDIKTHEQSLHAQQARYQAELVGATREGTTGIAGHGKNAKAAQIAADEEKANIAALNAQIDQLQKTGLDGARTEDEAAFAAGKNTAGTLQSDVNALESQSATTQQQLEQRRLDRTEAFAIIDRQAQEDASYKPPRQGPLANAGALAGIFSRPETSILTKLNAAALALTLFGFETSAVMLGLARRTTDSELRDAVLRARRRKGYSEQVHEPIRLVEDPAQNPTAQSPMSREDFVAAVRDVVMPAIRDVSGKVRRSVSRPQVSKALKRMAANHR